METGILRRRGEERGRAHAQTASAVVTRSAPHAELAENFVVECLSGRAPRSTAAA